MPSLESVFNTALNLLSQSCDKALAADLGHRKFDLWPFCCGNEIPLEVVKTPLFVLAD